MSENSPFSNEKLAEAIFDVRDRVIRIEEGQRRTEQIEAKADAALDTAKRADNKSNENARDIDGIKKTAMWAIGLTATCIVSLSAALLAVLLN
jgi:hypothetical protein